MNKLIFLIFCLGSGCLSLYSQTFESYTDTIPNTEVFFPMVAIPAGQFTIGKSEKDKKFANDELPNQTIELSSFWMGALEVTHDEFDIYRNEEKDLDDQGNPRVDGIVRPSPPYEDPSHNMGGFGFPAVGMTQLSALQYCKWLSDKTGHFYRLPTESEWEYAARAGTETTYFFGNKAKSLREFAWYEKNADKKLHEVGQLQPNPWGLYDIYGNVAEWTLDQYERDFYQVIVQEQWRKPTDLHPRSVRGGHFRSPAEDLRSSRREESSLNWKKRDPQIPKSFWWNTDSPFVGFRIVRPYPEPTPEEQAAFWELVLGG